MELFLKFKAIVQPSVSLLQSETVSDFETISTAEESELFPLGFILAHEEKKIISNANMKCEDLIFRFICQRTLPNPSQDTKKGEIGNSKNQLIKSIFFHPHQCLPSTPW